MITWIRENLALASVLAGLVGVISTGAVGWHQLSELVAAQPEIQKHLYDDSRHVDAEEQKKQEERMAELERRVRELEAQRWQRWIDPQKRRRTSDSDRVEPYGRLKVTGLPNQRNGQ
jgi:hypothetical protein